MQTAVYELPFMFGDSPLPLITPRPDWAVSNEAYFYLICAIGLAGYGLVRLIERARLGQLLRAKADSPIALQSLGVNISVLPLVAFCAAAFLAGVAGALLGPNIGVVGAGDFLTIPTSLMMVALLVLNGRDRRIGSLGASIGGALGLIVLPEYITSYNALQLLSLLFGVLAVEAALASTRASGGKRRGKGGPPEIGPPVQEADAVDAPQGTVRSAAPALEGRHHVS
jgi:ABC-type branched-subunit amino acid transport system permease subunit